MLGKLISEDVISSENAVGLDFRPVCQEDIPAIYRILSANPRRTCDYTIGGIYMWADFFRYEYCVYRDTLFIKGVAENDVSQTAFSCPVGAMPLRGAVDMILRYCRRRGLRPVFSAVPEECAGVIAETTGGIPEPLDDWADYVYDAASLASLSGKAYSKKRNHVNRFMLDNPGYVFEELSQANMADVAMFFDSMSRPSDDDSELAAYERAQCAAVLADYDRYPFEGAVLRDGSGRVVAFTVGEVIGDTLFVHIEKMNHDVDGAGETVNRLFADMMLSRHSGLRYINREEDVGDPGLRRAKESYRPLEKLRKFNVAVY